MLEWWDLQVKVELEWQAILFIFKGFAKNLLRVGSRGNICSYLVLPCIHIFSLLIVLVNFFSCQIQFYAFSFLDFQIFQISLEKYRRNDPNPQVTVKLWLWYYPVG